MKIASKFTTAIVVIGLVFQSLLRADPTPTHTGKRPVAYTVYVRSQIESIWDLLQKDKDYPVANDAFQALFDQTILFSPVDHPDCIREADFARRLVTQLKDVPASTRDTLLPFLRTNPNLAQTLVFLLRSDRQKSTGVYELLDQLRQKRPDQLEKYATLTSAICVVHSRPRFIHANENTARSADPINIFDYYVSNEGRMYFGIKSVPAELLTYVVDTTASISEMQWALNKFAGNREVGKLFFTIKYDSDYLKNGGDKTLTTKGFNLQNILHYGGVCIDQAYFATTVGKAIGVPTAMDTGSSGEAGHAWVGYLEYTGSTASWNFNSGRYQSYQGVQGSVQDPQTRQGIPDSYVSLLGEMINTKEVDRQNCVALTDAAVRLAELETSANEVVPPPGDAVSPSTISSKPRSRDVAAQLQLVESALRQSVAYTPAWFTVRDLAVAKKLTLADKQRWSDVLLRLGAKKYPDFTLTVLMPMVQTVEDPKEQDALLTNMLPLFATRMDLSASIRMAQGSLWESQKQPERAGLCYMDVVQRYCNDGPFVLDALSAAARLLQSSNRADQIPTLYGQAWSKTRKPGEMAADFVAASNWFRIGKLYEKRLSDAGDASKAASVESTLTATSKVAGKAN